MKHRPMLWCDREPVGDEEATFTIVCEACDPEAVHKVGKRTVRGKILRERLNLLDAAPIGLGHEEHAA